MKADELLDAIGMISDEYVQDAKTVQKVKRNYSWMKWGAMAACACLVVFLGLQSGFFGGSMDTTSNSGPQYENSSNTSTSTSNSGSNGAPSMDSSAGASDGDGMQESAETENNQGSYPFNDKQVLEYVGMELADMETESGTIVFNEITDMEMYRELNDMQSVVGEVYYDTHDGLYQYMTALPDTEYILMTVRDGLLEDRSGNEAFLQACEEQEGLERLTEYLLWEEKLGTSLYGAISEGAEAVALQIAPAEGPNGQVGVFVSKDLDALGEEMQAFVTPMREMQGTEQSTILDGQEVVVQYFYQQRMFREEAVEECYNYYVYFEKDDMQYLYQYSSNWTLPGEAVTALHNPPDTISEALSQEESRELFVEVLTGIVEALEQE